MENKIMEGKDEYENIYDESNTNDARARRPLKCNSVSDDTRIKISKHIKTGLLSKIFVHMRTYINLRTET